MRRLRRAHQRHARKRKKLKRRAIAAGTAAVITFGAGANLNKVFAGNKPDKHQQPVSQDADEDLLANVEEIAIGYHPFRYDQNRNQIPDGTELAKRCANIIKELPLKDQADPNETHKVEHLFYGLELCDVCGEKTNMGGCTIINPKLGLQYPDPNDPLNSTFLPYMALHYMTHGSFDCFGDIHSGRVDISRLLRVLELRYPYDPNEHQLAVNGDDLDGDFLTDNEELAAGYDLYDADQDDDLTPDGIELAKQCAEVIDSLPVYEPNTPGVNKPYKIQFFLRGLEYCETCDESVNMGFWQVVNPKLDLSIDVPVIVCHYMGHGSFSYSGDVHGKGRINVALLAKILEMPHRCNDLGTIYLPGDLNEDCSVNSADFAELAEKWLECTDPNEGKYDKQ
jgi:hypothetical protein